mgnify:FL=1
MGGVLLIEPYLITNCVKNWSIFRTPFPSCAADAQRAVPCALSALIGFFVFGAVLCGPLGRIRSGRGMIFSAEVAEFSGYGLITESTGVSIRLSVAPELHSVGSELIFFDGHCGIDLMGFLDGRKIVSGFVLCGPLGRIRLKRS